MSSALRMAGQGGGTEEGPVEGCGGGWVGADGWVMDECVAAGWTDGWTGELQRADGAVVVTRTVDGGWWSVDGGRWSVDGGWAGVGAPRWEDSPPHLRVLSLQH